MDPARRHPWNGNNDEAQYAHCYEDETYNTSLIMDMIVKSQKELGYTMDRLIDTYKTSQDKIDKQMEDFQRRWLELIKKGIDCHRCGRIWISRHICDSKSDKDKVSMIINEHRQRIDQPNERKNELMIEPITYISLPLTLDL